LIACLILGGIELHVYHVTFVIANSTAIIHDTLICLYPCVSVSCLIIIIHLRLFYQEHFTDLHSFSMFLQFEFIFSRTCACPGGRQSEGWRRQLDPRCMSGNTTAFLPSLLLPFYLTLFLHFHLPLSLHFHLPLSLPLAPPLVFRIPLLCFPYYALISFSSIL
jgi:hypothetical protein